jgi:UDP-N-acetylglucosamine--N-acetylmuramyl-(pentapeptide) pyrophosphoryl-undecaprenol N-acetylglucosamine transferase
MKKVIALTGGSTGGHVFPLLSVYNFLKDAEKYEFIWIWEENSLEEEIAEKNRIHFLPVAAGKIRRYFDIRNLFEPLKNMTGVVQSMNYIRKYKIDVVFSKGWYVSLPLCVAAKIVWKEVYIHESDVVTWLSNKYLSKFATKVFYSFPNDKIDGKKHIYLGQILNPELTDYIEDLEVIENERLRVLIIAWSQWSTTIFQNILPIIWELPEVDFEIILWEKNMHFRDDFKKFPNTRVHDFVTQKRLGKIYKEVDIAITRAGATTLWELYYFWIHAIAIPLKNSANNHQIKNALYFKEKFWSDILDEENELTEHLYNLIEKYKYLRKAGLNLEGFFEPLNKLKEYI